jgi:hypothetical protein
MSLYPAHGNSPPDVTPTVTAPESIGSGDLWCWCPNTLEIWRAEGTHWVSVAAMTSREGVEAFFRSMGLLR